MGLFDKFKKKSSGEAVTDPVAALIKHTAEKLHQVNRFWADYAKQKDALLELGPREAVEKTNDLLEKYVPGVYAEYEQNEEGFFRRLVFSADGVIERFNDVMMLTQNIPRLEDLSVVAFRQRSGSREFGIAMGDFSLQTTDIWMRPDPNHGRIALELGWKKTIEPEMHEHAKRMSVIMLDHILGEYDVVVKANSLDFYEDPLPQTPRDNWVPLTDFPDVFDSIWRTILGHTQIFPTGEDTWLSFEVTSNDDEDDVMIGMLNESAKAITCRADMGTRLDVKVQIPEREVLDRAYAYEEALNARLQPTQMGLHVLSLFPLLQRERTMTWYVFDEHSALQTAVDIAKQFADLEITFETGYDPRWDSYLTWIQD